MWRYALVTNAAPMCKHVPTFASLSSRLRISLSFCSPVDVRRCKAETVSDHDVYCIVRTLVDKHGLGTYTSRLFRSLRPTAELGALLLHAATVYARRNANSNRVRYVGSIQNRKSLGFVQTYSVRKAPAPQPRQPQLALQTQDHPALHNFPTFRCRQWFKRTHDERQWCVVWRRPRKRSAVRLVQKICPCRLSDDSPPARTARGAVPLA
jgi:hypothetical protein